MNDFSDDQLRAIGRVTVEAAKLDVAINSLIWRLMRVDFVGGYNITSQSNFSFRREMVMSLARDRIDDDALVTRLEKTLSRAGELNQRRKNLIDASWGHGSEIRDSQLEPRKIAVSLDGGPSTDIEALAHEIMTVTGQLAAILATHVPAAESTPN